MLGFEVLVYESLHICIPGFHQRQRVGSTGIPTIEHVSQANKELQYVFTAGLSELRTPEVCTNRKRQHPIVVGAGGEHAHQSGQSSNRTANR